MKHKVVGVDLNLLINESLDNSLEIEFKGLEQSFLFFGTLKDIICKNNEVFQDTQRGQNGKSNTAKSIINNGFVLPEDFILAKSEILTSAII